MARLMLAKSAPNEAIGWAKQGFGQGKRMGKCDTCPGCAYQAKGDRHTALALAEAEAAKRPASGLASYLSPKLFPE